MKKSSARSILIAAVCVLGALLVWILQDLAKRNLPLIGDILAYIMEAIRPD